MKKYFQISCHTLIITAFLTLAITGRLDFPTILLFTTCWCISLYRTFVGLPALLSGRGAFLLSCGYIIFFLLDSSVVSRSFIPASIHLVLFLQLAKLFQEKTDKDYLYLIILSFLQILAASSLTIDLSFVAAFFLFLIALVSTLMSFDMHRSERNSVKPAEQVARALGGMSLWATVWIIVTGLLLFVIIPRTSRGYFTRAAAQPLLGSGFTDSVQLGEIGQVKLSTAVVMHARPISGTPFAVLRWRGVALDRFDGHNWVKTDRKRSIVQAAPNDQYPIRRVLRPRDSARYEILLEPLATNTLFGPYQIRAISGRVQGVDYDSDDSVYVRFPAPRRLQYQVLSEVPDRSRMLDNPPDGDGQLPPAVSARYLQLPRGIDPRIAQLANEITAKGKSTLEKATLVEGYLKRNYGYTLNLTWKPGAQPVSTFLFESKVGHCEYFASSMAILLRSAGIPTRLVNGFLMGEYNPVGHDYIIRESDAHSWVEVYIPGHGWLEFDPTPPDPNRPEVNFAMQISHYLDAMELFWNSYVIVYDSTSQLTLFRSAQDRVQLAQATFREKSDEWLVQIQSLSDHFSARVTRFVNTSAFWAASFLLIAVGTAFKYRRPLRTQLRIWRARQEKGTVSDDVVEELFYRAAHLAERQVPKRRPAETWREWIFGLPDPNRRSILTKALEIFERSKYGRIPVSAEDFTLLEQAIRKLKSTS